MPSPWPQDALPSKHASLLSVASRAGILAAADPSTLVVAKTADVRATLKDPQSRGKPVVELSSSLKIPLPLRVSHVAFTSDEKYLVICAESGGLQGYETASLLKENTSPAFQIATEGIAIRTLVPNPADGNLMATVLADGKLMIADLQARKFQDTVNNGPLLKDGGVSCCSWSARGKQLVAGLEDGSVVQLKPDGQPVAGMPKPPGADRCYGMSKMDTEWTSTILQIKN